jgi:hypothetical protein
MHEAGFIELDDAPLTTRSSMLFSSLLKPFTETWCSRAVAREMKAALV